MNDIHRATEMTGMRPYSHDLTCDWGGCGSGTHVSSLQQFTSVNPLPLSAESPSWYQGQIIYCYLFRLFTSLFFSSFSPPPPRGCTRSCQSCKWRNLHHLKDKKSCCPGGLKTSLISRTSQGHDVSCYGVILLKHTS